MSLSARPAQCTPSSNEYKWVSLSAFRQPIRSKFTWLQIIPLQVYTAPIHASLILYSLMNIMLPTVMNSVDES